MLTLVSAPVLAGPLPEPALGDGADADIEISRTASPGVVPTYTLVISNHGPASATSVVLTDILLGTLINPVRASSDGGDPCLENNAATARTIVVRPLDHIVVAPNPVDVTAGGTWQFTATGYDANNNKVCITPVWSTDAGTISGSGLLTAQVTVASGRHVTATVGSVSGAAVVNIVPGALDHIVVTPNPVDVTAGGTQPFTATGYDVHNNAVSIAPVWSTDAGTIDSTTGVLTAQVMVASGRHVTATVGSVSGAAVVNIVAGVLDHITAAPNPVDVTAGGTQPFTAAGCDVHNNFVSITPVWSTDAGTIDSTTGVLTAQVMVASGRHVTATVGSVSGVAVVNIVPGVLDHITVAPNPVDVTAGGTQPFTATGYDVHNNFVSITPVWSTDGGTINSTTGVLTAQIMVASGRHVTATVGSVTGAAVVNIVPGALDHIVVTPNPADVTVGGTQPFTAVGYDVHNNFVSITPVWSSDGGTINSTTGVLTAQTMVASGRHVTATVGSMTGVAVVNIVPGALQQITVDVGPSTLVINSGAMASITATVRDTYGNLISGMTLSGSVSPAALGSVSELGATNADGQAFGTWTAGNVAGVGTLSVGNSSITGTAGITLSNPAPTITSISPTTATVGGPAFTLVVTGTSFMPGATVYWNGLARATTLLDSAHLTATIAANDIGAAGAFTVTVVNPTPGGGPSNGVRFMVVVPPAATGFKVYLPLVARNSVAAPDLVVERVAVSGAAAQVVIKNQGNAAVVDEFWVDLYVNPNPAPTGVNQIWNDGRCTQGILWGVTSSALPLKPGGTITLTYGDAYYQPALSNWGTIPVGTQIYAQADSANTNTTYGAVLETHEILGETYNNILGPVPSTLVVAGSESLSVPPFVGNGSYPISSDLPVRK